MWETLKELTTGKSCNQPIEKIVTNNNTIVTEPALIAEEFNNFFVKAGKSVSDSVLPVSKDPVDFLPKINPPDMFFNEISQGELVNIIEQMESKSSLDINGLSTKLIKFLKFELATPLVHLFHLHIRGGKFPSKLKASRTVPVFKTGDRANCDNYRPISLLSALSKILEKFGANQLVNHLESTSMVFNATNLLNII